MRVRCVTDTLQSVASQLADDHHDEKYLKSSFDVTPGQDYVVYAIEHSGNRVTYYLCGDDLPDSPRMYPAPIFQIIDPRLSSHWRGASLFHVGSFYFLLGFPEWVSDVFFYGQVVDEEPDAVAIWNKYRRLMDSEFA